MIAGVILSGTKQNECHLSFLDEETETFSLTENQEIVDRISSRNPAVVAVDSGTDVTKEPFNENEEDLKEEGYSFNPSSQQKSKVKRLQALKAQIEKELDIEPTFIRFDPFITSRELAIHGDDGLSSLGVETEDINSSGQFDAVLGAVTARFYQQDSFDDYGVIVPQSLDASDKQE